MVKLAIFVCALFAFGYTEVRSEETLENLQGKVAALEVTTESNATEAGAKAAASLELLSTTAMEMLGPTMRSVMFTVIEINMRFDILADQVADKNISECLQFKKRVHNVSLAIVKGMHTCLDGKINEGSEFLRLANQSRDDAQAAVANLKEKLEQCRTQSTPECLNNVNQEYESVANVRLPELLQNIADQEQQIYNVIPSLSDCAPSTNPVTQLVEVTTPALEQFRECLQNL